jgi:predicted N-formylglutamate amidohydrolase
MRFPPSCSSLGWVRRNWPNTSPGILAPLLARRLAVRLDAPAVLAGYSRLVIDCNRPPGDPTSIAEISDGIVIPGNRDLDDAHADARLNEVFWPYHHAITQTLAHHWRHDQAMRRR